MSDLDLLHFEQLKNEVQHTYLEQHTPSDDDISRWKGIDIIYFQEDLRKIAKGNISEKTFYTYFKTSPVTKLPRIDTLNLLSVYAGYKSWYEFKKQHLFADEILKEDETAPAEIAVPETELQISEETTPVKPTIPPVEKQPDPTPDKEILQTSTPVNQPSAENVVTPASEKTSGIPAWRKYLWSGLSIVLGVLVGILFFKDELFTKKFYYSFVDADRNSKINAELQVQILKENESPILYTAKPNEPFVYTTKSKDLTMVVSSPYYRTDTIQRNLETAPEAETIELKPNDYAIMLFYYSKSIKDLKKKRETLNQLISDQALIYQVYENETYGVETMDKQRYINLVTLPSTALENLEVIDTRNDKNNRINLIKFKITAHENAQ